MPLGCATAQNGKASMWLCNPALRERPTPMPPADPKTTPAAHVALARFTEYQLATLEGLPARTSVRERRRQQAGRVDV
jgi:hypothetical protein